MSGKASFHMSFLIALSSAVFGFSFSFLLSWKSKSLGAEQVSVATDPLAVHMPHLQLPSRTQKTVPKETVRSVRQNKKQKPRGTPCTRQATELQATVSDVGRTLVNKPSVLNSIGSRVQGASITRLHGSVSRAIIDPRS